MKNQDYLETLLFICSMGSQQSIKYHAKGKGKIFFIIKKICHFSMTEFKEKDKTCTVRYNQA